MGPGLYRLVAAMVLAGGLAADKPVLLVQAPDAPIRLDRATLLTTTDAPPVVLYGATNTTDETIDQFTVMAFVFDPQGTLKARQTAPARRTLEPHTAKFSTLVLDGSPLEATDRVVLGVNQAVKVGSERWWRAELQEAATAAARSAKP